MVSLDDQFNKIAQDTIERAGRVRCTEHEYAEGLQQIAEELLTAADAAEGMAQLSHKDQIENE